MPSGTTRIARGNVIINDKLLISGGRSSNNPPSSRLETFLMSLSARTKVNIETPVGCCQCVIKINETTILHTGGSNIYVDWTKFQNLGTKSTSNGPSLLTGRSYHGCGKLKIAGKTYLMVVGGQKSDDTLLEGSEFLDLKELVWKKGTLLLRFSI